MIDWDTLVVGPTNTVFGEPIAYQPLMSPALLVTGVFDEPFLEAAPSGAGPFASSERFALGAPGGVTTVRPILGVQLSQFLVPPMQGDSLTVTSNGVTYLVREVQTDNHGWAKLLLNESA